MKRISIGMVVLLCACVYLIAGTPDALAHEVVAKTPEPIHRGTPTPSPAPTATPEPTFSAMPVTADTTTTVPLSPQPSPSPTATPTPTHFAVLVPTSTPTIAPMTNPSPSPMPIPIGSVPFTNGDIDACLALGSEGIQVRILQARLQALEYLSYDPDGLFTNRTEAAVYAFQKQNSLYADGIARPETLSLLYGADAEKSAIAPVASAKYICEDAAMNFYQTKKGVNLYYDPALSQETGATVPAKTILLSQQAFGDSFFTTYQGAVGYAALNDVETLNPDHEIVQFSDVSVGYYIRKALGLLNEVESTVEVTATTARDRYAGEYNDIDVHLSDLAAVTIIDMDGGAKKSAGGAYTITRDPSNYNDLRLCWNLMTLKISTVSTAALDLKLLFDCRQLTNLNLENIRLKNMNQFWKLSMLRSLRIVSNIYSNSGAPRYTAVNPSEFKQARYPSDITEVTFRNVKFQYPLTLLGLRQLSRFSNSDESGSFFTGMDISDSIDYFTLFPIQSIFNAAMDAKLADEKISFPAGNIRKAVCTQLGMTDNELTYRDVRGMESLDLRGMNLSNITFLKYFTGLRELHLDDNAISDLTPLSGLASCATLSMSGNRVKDIKPLSHLGGLVTLDISENQISNIEPLSTLQSLKNLRMSGNKVKDLLPLSLLPGLAASTGVQEVLSDYPVSASLYMARIISMFYWNGDGRSHRCQCSQQ